VQAMGQTVITTTTPEAFPALPAQSLRVSPGAVVTA
jgi:hypothetical protein